MDIMVCGYEYLLNKYPTLPTIGIRIISPRYKSSYKSLNPSANWVKILE